MLDVPFSYSQNMFSESVYESRCSIICIHHERASATIKKKLNNEDESYHNLW